ncbi:hypothetical protein MRX96_026517 [Rhipicephalus microplus]
MVDGDCCRSGGDGRSGKTDCRTANSYCRGSLLDEAYGRTADSDGRGSLLDVAYGRTADSDGRGSLLDVAYGRTAYSDGRGSLLDVAYGWTADSDGRGSLLNEAYGRTANSYCRGSLLDVAYGRTADSDGRSRVLNVADSGSGRRESRRRGDNALGKAEVQTGGPSVRCCWGDESRSCGHGRSVVHDSSGWGGLLDEGGSWCSSHGWCCMVDGDATDAAVKGGAAAAMQETAIGDGE